MPPYYATVRVILSVTDEYFINYFLTQQPLKRALERMGVANLISDKFDNSLSFMVMSQLKKLKNQAKAEYDKICAEVKTFILSEHAVNMTNLSCSCRWKSALVKITLSARGQTRLAHL